MAEINLLGLMNATHAALPIMQEQGAGHIVNRPGIERGRQQLSGGERQGRSNGSLERPRVRRGIPGRPPTLGSGRSRVRPRVRPDEQHRSSQRVRLDNDGTGNSTPGDRTYGNDAFGYGECPGQYALAILSKKPIDERAVRTFRTFRWADMPDSLIVRDSDAERFLNDTEARAFRLSSKTHADVPIEIGGRTINALLAHPTPPVFDGSANFNGKRCHDEIHLLADYVAGERYAYDDSGYYGGLEDDASYVFMGDMNADPGDEESLDAANEFLLDNDDFGGQPLPTSPGGTRAGAKTATFDDGLTIDCVLPSPDIEVRRSDVV